MNAPCSATVTPGAPELEALRHIAAGRDPFAGCCACGDFGRRLRVLAALRRASLIDRSSRLTAAGQAALANLVTSVSAGAILRSAP